jgi:hypothetical protein
LGSQIWIGRDRAVTSSAVTGGARNNTARSITLFIESRTFCRIGLGWTCGGTGRNTWGHGKDTEQQTARKHYL